MQGIAAQAAHDGRHDVDLGAHGVVTLTELLAHARCNHQHRHVEATQVHLGDLLLIAKAVVTDDHKQGFLEVRLFAGLFKELAQGPVGVTHGRQMLVEAATVGDLLNRQWGRQCVRRVVGQGLQQCVERLAAFARLQFFQATVEHVLVGHAPCRVGEHRVDEVIAADEVGHALVAEEARLVVPGEIAVVDIHIVEITRTEQLRQARQLVAAFRSLHQVFETRQVREAGHGGEHTLVGVGAVGEEAVEQQALVGQLVEVRGDIARTSQCAHRMTSEAFHQDHHDVLDRQGFLGRWREVTAHGSGVGVYQLLLRQHQHVTHGLGGQRLFQGRLPDVGAVFTKARLGRRDQRQGAIEAQLVGEVRIGGVDVTPTQRWPLAQGATDGDHGDQQANHEHCDAAVPWRHLARADSAAAERAPWARCAVSALEGHAQDQRAHGPGQQVTHHRETVPEHAHHGFRVFLHILEDQAVEALVEFAVEVHLHQAQEQGDAGRDGQPQTEEPARRHGPHAEQRQQQRNQQVHHQANVQAQAVGERFKERRGRRIEDHLAVVDQQRQAQQGKHHHHDQCAEQRVRQMGFDGRLQQAI